MEDLKGRIKIIHIITMMELGGAQQNTLFTVEHLDLNRFIPFLVAGSGGELFDQAEQFDRFYVAPEMVRQLRPLKEIQALIGIIKVLKKIKSLEPAGAPVIVHTHSSKAGILGRWAAKLCGIKIIIHSVHGFGFNDHQPFPLRWTYILIEKLTALITTFFIAVSRANIEKGTRLGIFKSGNVALIRSGIDISSFHGSKPAGQAFRRNMGIPLEAPLVGMIGCFKPQKAPVDFVRVCVKVRQKVRDARFILAGDGILRERVEREIKAGGLEDCFFLAGWRRDMPDFFSALDLFVLTSLWEGLPRVIPEALASGVPVVATDVDGAADIITDGINGFLVPPRDIDSFAQRIIFLLEHPEEADKMSKRGKQGLEEFDIRDMVKRQEELYKQLILGRG